MGSTGRIPPNPSLNRRVRSQGVLSNYFRSPPRRGAKIFRARMETVIPFCDGDDRFSRCNFLKTHRTWIILVWLEAPEIRLSDIKPYSWAYKSFYEKLWPNNDPTWAQNGAFWEEGESSVIRDKMGHHNVLCCGRCPFDDLKYNQQLKRLKTGMSRVLPVYNIHELSLRSTSNCPLSLLGWKKTVDPG